jgi:hypothetical protein
MGNSRRYSIKKANWKHGQFSAGAKAESKSLNDFLRECRKYCLTLVGPPK